MQNTENQQVIILLKGEIFKGLTKDIGVSNYGRLFNRKLKKFIKPVTDKQGFYKFTYTLDKKVTTLYLHRAVMMLHNPTENMELMQVKRLDGDKLNNRLDNLYWFTPIFKETLISDVKDYVPLANEIFKDITWAANYKISNFGTITFKDILKKPFLALNKPAIKFRSLGIQKCVSNLVAEFFINNPNNYKYIKHKDGNLLNCKADNLEWSNNKFCNLPDQEIICEPGEYYLPCPIAGDNYYLSNFGTLRNIKSKEPRTFKDAPHGYKAISHNRGGKEVTLSQHRLLMTVFKPVEDMENLYVNHIDHNPANNNLDNLEWVSPKQNSQHSYKEGWCATEYNGIVKSTKGRYRMTLALGVTNSIEEAVSIMKETYNKLDLDTKYLKRNKKFIN